MSDTKLINGVPHVFHEGQFWPVASNAPEMPPINQPKFVAPSVAHAIRIVLSSRGRITEPEAVIEVKRMLPPGSSDEQVLNAARQLQSHGEIVIYPPRVRESEVRDWTITTKFTFAPRPSKTLEGVSRATRKNRETRPSIGDYVRSRGNNEWQPLQPVIDAFNSGYELTGMRRASRSQIYRANGIIVDRENSLFRLGDNPDALMG